MKNTEKTADKRKKRNRGVPHLYDHLDCSGVYVILYIPDGKFRYVGCAINIKERWRQHRTATKYTDDFHTDLRANTDKYECILLQEYDGVIKDQHELYDKLVPIECNYIKVFKFLGHPLVTNEENNLHTRKPTTEEKIKISEKMLGVPRPSITGDNNPTKRQDVRDKISAKVSGKNNGCYGIKFTWMHDDKHNYKVPKGQEKQKEKEGLVYGKIRVSSRK